MRGVLVFVLVGLLHSSSARADGVYFTESLGGTDVRDRLGAYLERAFFLRVGVGMRTGAWAVEAHLDGHLDNDVASGGSSLMTYGVDLKYLQPLIANHLEVYLRGGLRYGMFEDTSPERALAADYAGRGIGGGAGIQLKGQVRALGFLAWPMFFVGAGPKITGALWLDADTSFYRLHAGGRQGAASSADARHGGAVTIDARLVTISGGFAIGSDF